MGSDESLANWYYFDGDGHPRVWDSVCVVLDLLGFTEQTKAASSALQSDKLLNRLATLLDTDFSIRGEPPGSPKNRRFVAKAFSDTVVIGIPLDNYWWDEGAPELGEAIHRIAEFQLWASTMGFWCRGGVAIGELHVSERAVFGTALIGAHQTEHKVARGPRIVLSDVVWTLVRSHLSHHWTKDRPPDKPFGWRNDILIDLEDGVPFVNYLNASIDRDHIDYDRLREHRSGIERWFAATRSCDRYLAKSLWALRYHNEFCNTIASRYEMDVKAEMIADVLVDLAGYPASRHSRQVQTSDAIVDPKLKA